MTPGVALALCVLLIGALFVLLALWRRRARAAYETNRMLAARLNAAEGSAATVRAQLHAILESMDSAVIVLDREQRILSMNRAAETLLSVSDAESGGRLLQEVARQPELNRYVADALASKAGDDEFDLVGRPPRQVRASHRLLHGASGIILVLSDLTSLRRLESVRSDFASNVSHELRTPITNIKGYVETMLDLGSSADPAEAEKFLRIIQRNADRLGSIIDDMLMLAQLERPGARDAISLGPCPIARAVESVIAAHDAAARAKSITIRRETPEGLAAVMNQPLFEQALGNLLSNAIRYSPANTTVTIRAALADSDSGTSRVLIDVSDQGPGIAPEHLDRIFERFFRVDRARSREQGGTGLGLAIVKHIMNVHNGAVEVESTEGRGSRFRLTLPTAGANERC